MKRVISGAVPLALALLSVAPAANAQLVGASVSVGVYGCTSPTAPDLESNVLTGTVPVSFPLGSLYATRRVTPIPVSFSVTADQIIATYATPVPSAPGKFNGYVFAFSGLTSPITDVTVDPLS